jgi:hypothetical protein
MKEKMNLILLIDLSPNPRHQSSRVAGEFRIDKFDMRTTAATNKVTSTPPWVGAPSGDGPDIDW